MRSHGLEKNVIVGSANHEFVRIIRVQLPQSPICQLRIPTNWSMRLQQVLLSWRRTAADPGYCGKGRSAISGSGRLWQLDAREIVKLRSLVAISSESKSIGWIAFGQTWYVRALAFADNGRRISSLFRWHISISSIVSSRKSRSRLARLKGHKSLSKWRLSEPKDVCRFSRASKKIVPSSSEANWSSRLQLINSIRNEWGRDARKTDRWASHTPFPNSKRRYSDWHPKSVPVAWVVE